jgi:uncharacterized membrane protein
VRGAAATATPASAFLAFGIVPVLFHLVIVETSHVRLTLSPHLGALAKLGFVTASALTHWGIYLSLLLMFAATLRPGREALITTMARRMHGALTAEMERYTRRVTYAWCCFFAVQLSLSVGLFCFAPLVVWSFFVNILDIPLVAAMFGAEFACRLLVLQDPPRHSLKAILNMIADPAGRQAGQLQIPVNAARPD